MEIILSLNPGDLNSFHVGLHTAMSIFPYKPDLSVPQREEVVTDIVKRLSDLNITKSVSPTNNNCSNTQCVNLSYS